MDDYMSKEEYREMRNAVLRGILTSAALILFTIFIVYVVL
ncbi:hypothetical protein SAMN05216391_1093 [Lachnospiraceae bacterium KHCPX20]|nr:hypothetical protein SAMN05216391_1093 [Lachnospiraceae bacterium KHCPX20]